MSQSDIPIFLAYFVGIIHAIILDTINQNDLSKNIIGKVVLVLLVGAVLGYLTNIN